MGRDEKPARVRLSGRRALVTGAGSGIGAQSATALAAAGAAVVVTDIDFDAARDVAARIVDSGREAVAILLDVASENSWRSAIEAAHAALGAITILHSNAALMSPEAYAGDRGVVDLDVELFDRIVAVNMRGGMLACKHVLPDMIAAGGGSIVLTSSVKGATGSAHRTAYSMSKGGLNALTRVVAVGYGKAGIRCNAIAPGIVATEGAVSIPAPQRRDLELAHLTRTLGRPSDIAAAVVFLASDDAAFITGQVICVDGGLSAHVSALSPPGSRGET